MQSVANASLKLLDLIKRFFSDYIIAPVSTFAGWAAYVGKAPILILSPERATIRKEGFKRIFNFTDMRDGSFPDDHDVTQLLISQSFSAWPAKMGRMTFSRSAI